MSNFGIYLNILVNRFLLMFGLRRQQAHWGVVYDSVNKQPLDPVIVKLVDVRTGKVVQSGVTDLAGRYNFLAYPGRFKILVKKSNYNYPSAIINGNRDGIYHDLYHGEFFDLSGDSDVIPFNIPMDPVGSDWNQVAKTNMMKLHPFVETFFYRLAGVLFWFIFLFSVLGVFFQQSMFVYGLLIFYFLVFILALTVGRPRWWGRVWFKETGLPAEGAVVELSYSQNPTVIVAKAHVYADGKFFLRIDSGRYLLHIRQTAADGTVKVLYQKKVRVGAEHVLNKNFAI